MREIHYGKETSETLSLIKGGPSGTFLDNFLKFQIVESNPKSDLELLEKCPDRTPSGRFSFDRTPPIEQRTSELRFDVDKIRI